MTTTEMRVHMDCVGCERMVRKSLQNMKGIDSVDIDMAMQKVTVTGWADQKKILKRVRKSGRRAELWQFPYVSVLGNQNHPTGMKYNQHTYHGGPVTHYAAAPPPSSSYNYYKHGYDSHEHAYNRDYYGHQHGNSSIFGSRAGDAFSDESVKACFIM